MSALAWHFVGETLRDGRPIPADDEWLEHDGEIVLCETGLHASLHPFDALQYAPGNVLCRVECDGHIEHADDKLVSSRRRIIARKDCNDLLRLFARKQALSVGHLWNIPAIVQQYLETGDEELRNAALNAAWNSARPAAWAAAKAAAWAAAKAAARDAAKAAARDAAWDAAGDAAWDAARKMFADMVYAEFGIVDGAA